MDVTTLVLVWDDVFQALLGKVSELLGINQTELFDQGLTKIIFSPLKKMCVETLQFLFEQLQNSYIQTFWHAFFESLLKYLYILLIIILGMQLVTGLLKKLYLNFLGGEIGVFKTINNDVLKKFFLLQIIHFVGVPVLKTFFEIYPGFIQSITSILAIESDYILNKQILRLQLSSELLFFEVICLVLLVVICSVILFQFIRQGMFLSFAFIRSYLGLITSSDVTVLFLPLKQSFIHIFVVFVCQKILLVYIFQELQQTLTAVKLLQIVAMFAVVATLPKFFSTSEKIVEMKVTTND